MSFLHTLLNGLRRRNWLRTVSLRMTLIIFVLMPLTGLIALSGWLSGQAAELWSEHRLEEELELISRSLRKPASRALAGDDIEEVNRILEAAFQFNRVYSAYVYDTDGRRLAEAGEGEADTGESELARLASEGDRRGEYGTVQGREVYSYFQPLTDAGGRVIGLFQITRRASDIEEYAGSLQATILGLLGALAVFMIALVWAGHHVAIGKPLERLRRVMGEVGSGDLARRADVRWPVELAEVSTSFNRMLDDIEAAEREIEAHRAAEDALQKRLRQAETMASVGRLAAGVAHELGTPLAIIDGRAQRLSREKTSSTVTRASGAIRDQVGRMSAIVHRLLDFGRSYEGYRSRIALREIAVRARDRLESEAERMRVTVDLEGDASGPVIEIDVDRTEQAVAHLVRNAVQAAGQGGRVRLAWGERDGTGFLRVEDSGAGVPEDQRERIFEPFFTTKQVGEGSGLGLAVVHGVVEQHGGSIEVVDSSLGGAGFVVWLPAGESAS